MLNDTDLAAWMARIESEYREMPGLLLTKLQMQRLWGLDELTCDAVVGDSSPGMFWSRHARTHTLAAITRHERGRIQPWVSDSFVIAKRLSEAASQR